jgi:hypothetical protein
VSLNGLSELLDHERGRRVARMTDAGILPPLRAICIRFVCPETRRGARSGPVVVAYAEVITR